VSQTGLLPEGWHRLTTIDAHTAGEPLRVVTSGIPAIPGQTMLAKRRWASENLDRIRRSLMLEPRGHGDMYGCFLTDPVSPDGDLGVLFLHNQGYSTMCGHGIIALVTVALECRLLDLNPAEIRIDTPAGRVTAEADFRDGRVERVSFENVPSFAVALEQSVDVAGLGPVPYDLAFGGAFYAYVAASDLGLGLAPADAARLITAGRDIKRAVSETALLSHPSGHGDMNFLYGTIFHGTALGAQADRRNVCVFADGELDRSPTGTGVSGWAALEHHRGALQLGQSVCIESILGTTFEVAPVRLETLGTVPAVVPRVTGSAHLTGRHEFIIDPEDPLRDGFLLR